MDGIIGIRMELLEYEWISNVFFLLAMLVDGMFAKANA